MLGIHLRPPVRVRALPSLSQAGDYDLWDQGPYPVPWLVRGNAIVALPSSFTVASGLGPIATIRMLIDVRMPGNAVPGPRGIVVSVSIAAHDQYVASLY